jgi:hypothetical protein
MVAELVDYVVGVDTHRRCGAGTNATVAVVLLMRIKHSVVESVHPTRRGLNQVDELGAEQAKSASIGLVSARGLLA